jgi:protein SCO1/2
LKRACAPLAAAILGAGLGLTAAWGQDAAPDDAAQLMNELMSGKGPVGGPFTLDDPDGRARSLAEFRGRAVLLVFGYVGCPDVCPTELAEVARVLDLLDGSGSRLQAIFVTLDPARDSAAVLRNYAAAFHPRLLALRGSAEQTRAVARAYKVAYRAVTPSGTAGYLIEHSAFIYVLDADGKYLAFLPPGTSAERMAAVLRPLLAAPTR